MADHTFCLLIHVGVNKYFLKFNVHNFPKKSDGIVASGFTRDTATLAKLNISPSDICFHLVLVFWNKVSLSSEV